MYLDAADVGPIARARGNELVEANHRGRPGERTARQARVLNRHDLAQRKNEIARSGREERKGDDLSGHEQGCARPEVAHLAVQRMIGRSGDWGVHEPAAEDDRDEPEKQVWADVACEVDVLLLRRTADQHGFLRRRVVTEMAEVAPQLEGRQAGRGSAQPGALDGDLGLLEMRFDFIDDGNLIGPLHLRYGALRD